ncbi:hypothetical protein NDU88_001797 [Pleurodeles waltl]|uniref:Uncharacterized protein n=1 Tax=Pleurodeles waltl TaxID=8319 RepID=A0AAV7TJX7_PLEWA|nr:hypothetical protein NDU88_001797 [Pleurodeles waltl]
MPRGKTAGKAPRKPARQLLFSEALRQQKHPVPKDSPPPSHDTMSDNTQGASMDRILQEISAVGCKLEGMDTAMSALTAETRSMRLEIAGFQSQISGLDHRVAAVESQVVLQTDREQELLYLRSKLTDLEDRCRRNNIRFLGFPEGIEGTDILSYLRDTLPKLADITFDPPLEFQRAHRLGLKRQNGQDRPRPIIACFLRHGQVRQLLQLSRRQGPLQLGPLEIRLSADFSKETADRRRAFLSFRPRLRHLDVKFGLFVLARMWITKNGESRTFYDPEDLKSFLEGLHDPTQSMESTTQPPQDTQNQTRGMGQSEIALDTDGRPTTDPQTRGRDLERLTKRFRIPAFGAAWVGPFRAARSAARQRKEKSVTWLPQSDFLHFLCRVLVVGRHPEVELRAFWPFDVHGPAAWAGPAAELRAACCALEEGSGSPGYARQTAQAGPWSQPRETVERRGPGNGQRASRAGFVRCNPEGGGCGSPRGELSYWCMVQGLVTGPTSEEALGLLHGTFWEHPDHLSPGLPARRWVDNSVPWLRVLRNQATDLNCPSGAATSRYFYSGSLKAVIPLGLWLAARWGDSGKRRHCRGTLWNNTPCWCLCHSARLD